MNLARITVFTKQSEPFHRTFRYENWFEFTMQLTCLVKDAEQLGIERIETEFVNNRNKVANELEKIESELLKAEGMLKAGDPVRGILLQQVRNLSEERAKI